MKLDTFLSLFTKFLLSFTFCHKMPCLHSPSRRILIAYFGDSVLKIPSIIIIVVSSEKKNPFLCCTITVFMVSAPGASSSKRPRSKMSSDEEEEVVPKKGEIDYSLYFYYLLQLYK